MKRLVVAAFFAALFVFPCAEALGQCSTERPELVRPARGDRFTAGTEVAFVWNGVPGATGYDVMITPDFGQSWIAVAENTTARSASRQLDAGDWGWYVRANFAGSTCNPTFSEPSAFTVTGAASCNNPKPVLVSPANNARNVASPVTFEWRAVPNAVRYAVAVAPDDGELELYGTARGTSLTAFVPDGVIRWAVVAFFDGCQEVVSDIHTFTAGEEDACPAGTITLQTPQQNATVNSPVTLSWSALAGVTDYRVTILVDGETPVTRRVTATNLTIELPAGRMSWLVEGLRDDCRPVLSNRGEFTVARATNCDANPAPLLVAPVGTEADPADVTSPVTFSWNASVNAIAYRLWVSRNGAAFEDVTVTDKTTISVPLPGGVYRWYLEAAFRGCDAVRSATAWFEIPTASRCTTAAPQQIAPAQNANVQAPVLFSWSAVEGAEAYRLFVSFNEGEERLAGVTPETSLERVLPPGRIAWRVEAVIPRCASTTSPVRNFTIRESNNCHDAVPQIVTPANGTTTTEHEIDFSWSAVGGAVRYVVFARSEDGAGVPIGETTNTTLTRKVPFGRIEWWVVAFFAGCAPAESPHARFAVVPTQNCSNRGPILLLPSETTPQVYSPVTFAWSRVPSAAGYQVWAARGSDAPSIIATTTENAARVALPPGAYRWYVEAKFANCPSVDSAFGTFTVNQPVACGTPGQPRAHVVGQALSNTPYRLRWTPLPNVDVYEVQESTSPTFENAQTIVADEPSARFVHEVTAPTQYLYRVRGISRCDDSRGSYSDPVGVFVIPARTNNASAEVGVEGNIVQTLVLPASTTPLTFVAKVDKPWLTVTPSSGTVGNAPVTLTITANPSVLNLGTNTGTVTVTYTSPSSGNLETHATTTTTSPVSVSLVTPVTPTGKGTPPPDALIFPIVGHAAGVNDSLFESDIRIANLTPQTMKYQVNFTPSGTDGTQTGSSTSIEVAPNTTIALDDIVASLFGTGTTSSALGMLEVRPLASSSATTTTSFFSSVTSAFPALNTAASSRTYNFTPNGTFGQFIPAIPFSKFASKGTVLSLLQVSQSAAYRANFGFAEAAGSPVELMVRVFDTKNELLATIPVSLGATQHTQINGMLAANGINDLADGRVEVEVVNGNGKVTAYVSAIDNKTNDPLLVNAVPKATTAANRWVVPGMAYIDNGFAFWVSDLRVFNAGTAPTPATLTFYPQGNGTPVSKQITLDGGEIEVLDNVVSTLFGQPNGAGGAIAITTPANAQLHATARTYNQTANGTYGQFIPSVTVAESVGMNDRALQLLQLETSSRFRTNIGLSETSGNPVRVEITAIQPDSIVTPVITVDLAAGEFRQLSLADFFDAGAAVYNARVTVKAISGTGRVTAYGSAIDLITQDPTYVPAQ